jgi:hypothetical protein
LGRVWHSEWFSLLTRSKIAPFAVLSVAKLIIFGLSKCLVFFIISELFN